MEMELIDTCTGLGNIAGLCGSRRVTICQEGNEFASVGTAAHELGHKSVYLSQSLNHT